MKTNYEKYLAGEPLNEELAKMKRGELPMPPWERWNQAQPAAAGEQRAPLMDPERQLNRAEQAALRELRQGPGWPVLQRLLERATINHTNSAILLSQDDPAGKTAELAQAWLTVKTWKQLVGQLNDMVAMELLVEQLQEIRDQGSGETDGRNEDEPTQQGA